MTGDDRTAIIRAALDRVEDPEIPITLRDLGVLREVEVGDDEVVVRMVATRMGCPAIDDMARRVRAAVHTVDADVSVQVQWGMEQWSAEDITADGRATLREAGYGLMRRRLTCPYCGSEHIRQDGVFGGSLCQTPFICRDCGSTFEAVRSALEGARREE